MAPTKMGFEGKIYYGAAGSTASTELVNSRDISTTTDPQKGDTTPRGDGSAPPIGTERVTRVNWSCDFNMLEKVAADDASLEAMKVAAAAGTPVALRMKDHAAGKGYDGDVTLSHRDGKPLNGEQTHDFTATPTAESGRAPQLYV